MRSPKYIIEKIEQELFYLIKEFDSLNLEHIHKRLKYLHDEEISNLKKWMSEN